MTKITELDVTTFDDDGPVYLTEENYGMNAKEQIFSDGSRKIASYADTVPRIYTWDESSAGFGDWGVRRGDSPIEPGRLIRIPTPTANCDWCGQLHSVNDFLGGCPNCGGWKK